MGYKDTSKILINKRKEILDEFIRTNKRWMIIEPSQMIEDAFGTKDFYLIKKEVSICRKKI